MKKLNAILLASAMIAGGAVISEAQIHQGAQEVSFSGSYYHGTRGNDNRVWNLTGTYGYFFTPQLEFVGVGQLTGSRGGDTGGYIGAGADWHFVGQANQNFVPFAGAVYLVGVGDVRETNEFGETVDADAEDLLEIHGGVKQFLARNIAVKYQVGYGFDPSNTSDAAIRATVGLSFFF